MPKNIHILRSWNQITFALFKVKINLIKINVSINCCSYRILCWQTKHVPVSNLTVNSLVTLILITVILKQCKISHKKRDNQCLIITLVLLSGSAEVSKLIPKERLAWNQP